MGSEGRLLEWYTHNISSARMVNSSSDSGLDSGFKYSRHKGSAKVIPTLSVRRDRLKLIKHNLYHNGSLGYLFQTGLLEKVMIFDFSPDSMWRCKGDAHRTGQEAQHSGVVEKASRGAATRTMSRCQLARG